VYKYLLLSYYRKTVSFDEELPTFSMLFFKVGILIHCIVAGYMFTDKQLISVRFENFENIPMGGQTFS
jgi:hypothetical protein